MFKKFLVFLLCLTLMSGLAACGSGTPSPSDNGKIKVSVTFNALKEFTQAVGGDKVDITTIIPDGMEPHDFEPKAKDLVSLSKARVFVYNGLGMESWAEDTVAAVENKRLYTVDASTGISPISNSDPDEISEHGQYDPHIWLSLKCAEIEVGNIRDALIRVDPNNKEFYEKNSSAYISKLEGLYNEYNKKFGTVEKKSFVTGHAAFAYMCRDFGLSQKSVEDVFAEGEPSAQQLTELCEYCRSNNVKTVFSEALASPEVSETLAKEVGASVETIYTVESSEDGKTYLERMETNLQKIYDSFS